jgi:two-component system OmpR family sensor kinase
MTPEGTGSQASRGATGSKEATGSKGAKGSKETKGAKGAARLWRAVRWLSDRMSLRTKLVTALLALVIFALAAMGFAGVSLLRGYLITPIDNNLKNATVQQMAVNAVNESLNNVPSGDLARLAASGYAIFWLPSGGSLQPIVEPSSFPAGPSQGEILPSGSLSSIESWLTANPETPITVPGHSSGDRWRVIGVPATDGTVVIGTDVSSVYSTLRQLTGVDLIVSVVIVFVLAIVGFAVVQANLRPLVDIEETAGEIAAGHLNRRVPERDPRTEVGRLGRSLNIMLSQIETAFHAREESEAAAHESEERMRRFVADASHELRTPLTAIRGFAEYYRQRGGLVRHWDREEAADAEGGSGSRADAATSATGLTPDDLDRIMQRVEKEAARMGLLVEDLLLLARLDQQRPLAAQPVDLLSLAADAVHDARLLAPDRTIDLSVQPGAAFLVIGDEPRLRQVIGNLMSNALTHTPDGSPIEVSVSSGTVDPRAGNPTPAVILDVTDHGPGMTAEQAHRVFERFYRADQARTRGKGGSGLGLAIVAALVAAQGGVASVRTAEGKGATFRITLPLAPEALGSQHPDDDPDQPDPADGPDDPGRADESRRDGRRETSRRAG